MPSVLAIEILAQAVAVALTEGDLGGAPMVLAGIDDARFESPLRPADTLVVHLVVEGRFGRMIKVRGTLSHESSGDLVASASLLLAG